MLRSQHCQHALSFRPRILVILVWWNILSLKFYKQSTLKTWIFFIFCSVIFHWVEGTLGTDNFVHLTQFWSIQVHTCILLVNKGKNKDLPTVLWRFWSYQPSKIFLIVAGSIQVSALKNISTYFLNIYFTCFNWLLSFQF